MEPTMYNSMTQTQINILTNLRNNIVSDYILG